MKTKKSKYKIVFDDKREKPKIVKASHITEAVEMALATKKPFTNIYPI